MGLFNRLASITAETRAVMRREPEEQRTITVPWSYQPWNSFSTGGTFNLGGPAHPSRSGSMSVDSLTGLPALYSCVRIISESIASLPLKVYRSAADGSPQLLSTSQLLDSPSSDPAVTAMDWVGECLRSLLLWGNSVGLITSRTGLALPQTIDWLDMDQISYREDMQGVTSRARVYFQGRQLEPSEIVHVRAFSLPGRKEALGPIRQFAHLFQHGLAGLSYGHSFLANGGFPPGTFQNVSEEVDQTSANQIRQRLTDSLRLNQPLVYGKDWEYKAVSVPPSEAQYVEMLQMNATQVAAIFGVPPSMVGGRRGDSLTYATVEQEALSLITSTLRPWIVRLETLFSQMLPASQYCRFDVDALLKTDTKTRVDIAVQRRKAGLLTTDEIRASEDLPPLPNGNGNVSISLDTEIALARGVKRFPTAYDDQLGHEDANVPAPKAPAGPPRGFGTAGMRCGNAERDRACSILAQHHRDGRLDSETFHERSVEARRAVTNGQLTQLFADLPQIEDITTYHRMFAPVALMELQNGRRGDG